MVKCKKGEFRIAYLFIMITMFALLVTGFFIFMGDLYVNYEVEESSNYSAFYGGLNQTLNTTYELVKDIEAKVQSDTNSSSLLGYATLVPSSVLATIKMVFTSFGTILTLTSQIVSILGINVIFKIAFITIVTTVIIFAILSAIIRWRLV